MSADSWSNLDKVDQKIIEILNKNARTPSKEIATELRKSKEKDIWKEFEMRFNNVQNEFYDKLANRYPDLTANDLRLSAFLKLNMASKEISQLTGQQISTIEHTRSRIRKKLGISNTRIDLVTFLSQI